MTSKNMDIVNKALAFAAKAHKGQKRKYTCEPYINHPIAVSELVKEIGGDENMIVAALLHDTVEDCNVSIMDIVSEFNGDVAILVYNLTDISRPEDGNRKLRKSMDRIHISNASKRAKTIKLADLIDNSKSILERDPEFAKTYMYEKKLLLEALADGNEILFKQAQDIVQNYYS